MKKTKEKAARIIVRGLTVFSLLAGSSCTSGVILRDGQYEAVGWVKEESAGFRVNLNGSLPESLRVNTGLEVRREKSGWY